MSKPSIAPVHRHAVPCEVKAVSERRYTFVVSDGGTDRMGDRIDPKGWDFDEFNANPVMLWNHNSYAPPLGKWTNVRVEKGQVVADAEFLPPGIDPFADAVNEMVRAKVVQAASVGFLPIQTRLAHTDQERDELGLGPWGVYVEKARLLEISLVTVPANPRALAKSLEGKSFEVVRRVLDACASAVDLEVKRDDTKNTLERVLEHLQGLQRAALAGLQPQPTADAKADCASSEVERTKQLWSGVLANVGKRNQCPK